MAAAAARDACDGATLRHVCRQGDRGPTGRPFLASGSPRSGSQPTYGQSPAAHRDRNISHPAAFSFRMRAVVARKCAIAASMGTDICAQKITSDQVNALLIRPCQPRHPPPRLPLMQGHCNDAEEVNRLARLNVRERDWSNPRAKLPHFGSRERSALVELPRQRENGFTV